MSWKLSLARLGFFVTAAAAALPAGAGGLVDTGFAAGGVATVGGTLAQGPAAVVVRPNGRLIYAARRYDGGAIVLGARKTNGAADGSFNNGNPLIVTGFGAAYTPRLANDPTGNAVILAFTDFQAGVYRLTLCRIFETGSLDAGFTINGYPGQSGCVRTNPPGGAPNGIVVASVDVWTDGRIVFGGTAYDFSAASIGKPVEGRVTPGVGIALSTLPVPGDYVVNAYSAVQFTNVTYFAGNRRIVAGGDAAGFVMRADQASAITATFNPNLVPNGIDDVRSIAILPNDRLVAAATVDAPNQTTTCAVYSMDVDSLEPDLAFGPDHDGKRYLHFGVSPTDSTRCEAIVGDAQNRIYVGGSASLPSYAVMAAARVTPVGAPDDQFGAGGHTLFNSVGVAPTTYDERVYATALQSGRLILAGPSERTVSATPATSNLLLVRLTDDEHLFAGDFE